MSEAKGREGASFVSPGEQRDRITAACKRDGLELIAVHEEIDVSGGRPLAKRKGLREAVAAVEAGEAEVVMVAYFDRLVRSLRVQDEVVSRVEAAGGRVLALDVGQITGASAAKWLSGTMLGAVNEYFRRSVGERSAEAQEDAVRRGVAPWNWVPLGYRKRGDGRLEPDPATGSAIREAWSMRAKGQPIRKIREWLRQQGVEASHDRVARMFAKRVYLGEIYFGALRNTAAHEPLIDQGVWDAVQRLRVSRGPVAKSSRLLARLGILRCAGCDGPMVVSKSGAGQLVYRCPKTTSKDCDLRVTIQVELAEAAVVEAILGRFGDAEGRAAADLEATEASDIADEAQADLDAAIRAFSGVADEPAAIQRIAELRQVRDAAAERARHLSGLRSAVVLQVARDWDRLTLAERREVISAVLARAVVGRGTPGHRSDRVGVQFFDEDAPGRPIKNSLDAAS